MGRAFTFLLDVFIIVILLENIHILIMMCNFLPPKVFLVYFFFGYLHPSSLELFLFCMLRGFLIGLINSLLHYHIMEFLFTGLHLQGVIYLGQGNTLTITQRDSIIKAENKVERVLEHTFLEDIILFHSLDTYFLHDSSELPQGL